MNVGTANTVMTLCVTGWSAGVHLYKPACKCTTSSLPCSECGLLNNFIYFYFYFWGILSVLRGGAAAIYHFSVFFFKGYQIIRLMSI